MTRAHTTQTAQRLALLRGVISHLEHVLPGQAPVRDFVHHNTLHGFQHQPFPQALAIAQHITGASGYLPDTQFREFHRNGRISQADLEAVIDADPAIDSEAILLRRSSGEPVTESDIVLAALLYPLKAVTACQLNWQVEELDALVKFQPDVEPGNRARLLDAAHVHGHASESEAIADLWTACLHCLGLDHYILHPEDMLDISAERAEAMLAEVIEKEERRITGQLLMDRLIDREAGQLITALFNRVGTDLTLAGLLMAITGENLLEVMRPLLVRSVAAFLDLGNAAWSLPDRQLGFYAAWRDAAEHDLAWIFEELPDWRDSIDALPDDPVDAILIELRWLGLEESQWAGYLERVALELPGWSGMFLWRHNHPGYGGLDAVQVDMADYLAVRLVLERLYAQRLCRQLWLFEASFDVIRWYFQHNRAEFMVRHMLYNTHLPEYLISMAQRLTGCSAMCRTSADQWRHLAHMIWTWRQSPAGNRPGGFSVHRNAWRLFRLMQHLGICGADIARLEHAGVERIFSCLDRLDSNRSGYLWLQAYEKHYRDQLFNALLENRSRSPRHVHPGQPEAQIVFCMDDREEGIRRHLEESNPAIETFGAAGFFGVAINWRGLDDTTVTPLCPIMVTPSHEIHETPLAGQEGPAARHAARRAFRLRIKDLVHQETRRNLLRSTLMILLAAPAALLVLTAKVFAHQPLARLSETLRRRFDCHVDTRVDINSRSTRPEATPEQPQPGFTDDEQADMVQAFLRTIGLLDQFAPLVVMMGHGSSSQNNPHLAAYDCGACSGRHGGPNARVFAAMANRPGIRERLRQRGCNIPKDTWFLGAEHNTCDEKIIWYDQDLLPADKLQAFTGLRESLETAALGSAHERARRLASAPKHPTPQQALRHMTGRASDFSQTRPELGHAANAAAFIGRRAMSKGVFFDRRVFLVSYDPATDPDGEVLENILLAAAPVSAGINLEYYFSTVNNERYGCGSKVTHNVTGLFGIMDGTSSDLRTGLPKQMIEIHEAMRLQVVVEASTGVLMAIYERQPPLQELIANGWLLLSAIDQESGAIEVFNPGSGFTPWQGRTAPLPRVTSSQEWYSGHDGPLPPARIDPVSANG